MVIQIPKVPDGRATPAPRQSIIPPKIVRIQSEKYLVRTIAADDASDRWAGWMGDPEAAPGPRGSLRSLDRHRHIGGAGIARGSRILPELVARAGAHDVGRQPAAG